MTDVLLHYLTTFGWALTGSIAMGIGIVIALKLFTLSTRNLDEWKLISEGNMAMGVIIAAVIIAVSIVIAAAIRG